MPENLVPKYIPDGRFEKFHASSEAIHASFDMITQSGQDTLLDYGAGRGSWSFFAARRFKRVIAVDINPSSLDTAKKLATQNGISNIDFVLLQDLTTYDLPRLDAMISIMVIELAASEEIIQMFDFASKNLKSGGRFLCMTRRPVGFLRTLLFLERLRWEGLRKGIRRTLSLARSAIEAVISPEIQSIPRARFYHTADSIYHLAKSCGLHVAAGPNDLASRSAFVRLDIHCTGHWFFGLRQTDWYIIERP